MLRKKLKERKEEIIKLEQRSGIKNAILVFMINKLILVHQTKAC